MPYQMDYIEPAPLDARAEQVMVPMRDGVRLATDVYLPDSRQAACRPMLVRLPYDKCARYTFMPQIAPFVTDRGYALVVQDVRGKFRSEGETLPFVHEIEDGYDTLEWIAAQPWSDGTVGHVGRLLLRVHAVGRRRQRTSGAARHRPARHGYGLHGLRATGGATACSSSTAPTTWRTSGPTATSTTSRSTTVTGRWPSCSTRASPPSAGAARRSTASCSVAGPAGSRRSRPAGTPSTCQKVPALHSVGWFDNVMPYSMRDYIGSTAIPERADLQYLLRRADRPRELPARGPARHAGERPRHRTTPPWSGSSRGWWGRASTSSTCSCRGRRPARGRAARALARRPRRLGGVGCVAARRAPASSRLHLGAPDRAADGRRRRRPLRERGASSGRAVWTHDPAPPRALRDRRTRSRCSGCGRDETAVEGRPTS